MTMKMKEILDLVLNTADGVLAVDRQQQIVLWNKAAEALLGLTAEETVGRYCYEVLGGRDESGRPVCRSPCASMMTALSQQLVPTRDLLVRTKAGREVWLSVSTVLVPSRWNDLSLLVHIFRDVSRQKESEQFVQHLLSIVPKVSSSLRPEPNIRPPLSPTAMNLSRREQEVLRLLASGVSTQAIATQLFISPSTVQTHIRNILTKLEVHSRLEAVSLSIRHGLI